MIFSKYNRQIFIQGIFFLIFFTGCANFPFRVVDINFDDPSAKLGIQNVKPTAEEADGVVLRFFPPNGGRLSAREETTMYHFVKDGRGMEMKFDREMTILTAPGSREDSYMNGMKSVFKGEAGEADEKTEVTTRGEILQFIQGFHKSKYGKLIITNWRRAPMLPEWKIKIGDHWSYDEIMDVRIDSRWVKQEDPLPYIIKAESELAGFALVGRTRCVVIKTRMTETKQERLKVLFKELVMNITANVEELIYLDYQTGTLTAKITKIHSEATDSKMTMTNKGESQSIYYLL
ncbi:MAG: hypothetical protein A3G33_00990 [Omnitrophica bacterium RIFCSPLOWO2_12_FULL_44_17]|uniref:Uncharacterized protein n=1 Tax=Candidatus Danuiimicrobium aquiferis TaxID=1801832 RepID=A0A1G1L2W9_9BACT|nr:MAG: hypothetical protein A3B72_06545 [Omnitrophica bacterium RIFCSPHIGHO2_02_FULL_45_28]OGW89668.1 MAG: hypothetical protein A3E74_04730 [Omnitrophica bacterium RIFCSPHIGHO2_12_FULL_44_12]OGW99478.1 MAG: hypothetical protein A3G33_00990 [Omnitrophica bacterium RIFCSPLOWO2_12_FULL_44_17]OGX04314.1 MAG: hypothetical protein A3J12_00700 [Omnitrophica bacterium RIFCSPLOWO2_02_FULL_44_11]